MNAAALLPTSSLRCPHPAQVPAGPGRLKAIETWCVSGWDPHLMPNGERVCLHRPDQMVWTEEGFDASVWSLVLTSALGGSIEQVTAVMQHILKSGAEVGHPLAVKGGHITPAMGVLAGPLDEAAVKLRQLRTAGAVSIAGRWPTENDSLGDAAIHSLVEAMPGTTQEWRPAMIENMIKDLFEEVLGTGQGMVSAVLLRDGQGALALHRALLLGRYEVASYLLHAAPVAQARALDNDGNGALHALVQGGWPTPPAPMLKLARELAQHGARWHDPNTEGLSALDLALKLAKSDEERTAWRGLAQRSGA